MKLTLFKKNAADIGISSAPKCITPLDKHVSIYITFLKFITLFVNVFLKE